MAIKLKRIKTRKELIDVLCMLSEDMYTYNLTSKDTNNFMSKLIDKVREEEY